MTRQEFLSTESNVARLAELFRDPVLRAAIEVIKAEGFPHLPEPVPGVDYGAQVSSHGAFITGWQRGIRALELLSFKVVPVTSGRAFAESQYNDAAKRRMRESGIYTDEEITNI